MSGEIITLKLLNDSLVDVCKALDDILVSDNVDMYINDNLEFLDLYLGKSSNILAVVPDEIKKVKTWEYDRGGEIYPAIEGEDNDDGFH
jgi:hypothetical protein